MDFILVVCAIHRTRQARLGRWWVGMTVWGNLDVPRMGIDDAAKESGKGIGIGGRSEDRQVREDLVCGITKPHCISGRV